jgi:putative ABC transport system substrate-binding protein
LVGSLARPGGNVTGVAAAFAETGPKCVELLQAVAPGIKRLGFLGNADNPANRGITFKHIQMAAGTRGITVKFFSATRPDQIGAALAAIVESGIQGVVVSGDSVIRSRRQEITEFVAEARVPAAYFGDDYVRAGGLMSYGPNREELDRQAAAYVDRILKGARWGTFRSKSREGST